MTTSGGYPGNVGDERTMLENWLDFHRETLARICEGLDEKQLKEASVPPANLTLLGLVRHMAEVERNWFQRVLGESPVPGLYISRERMDRDFELTEEDRAEEGFAAWRREIEAARAAAAGRSLDDTCRRPRDGEEFSLRWIYVHMIEEYARHNGHADLIRQRIDGVTGR
ncbi:DinB family protein [Streptomyces aidingensis]|uniref:DinB family protein n=1 Tax=Streptomyces aidingensis TaxID=910347 RepID=A0A1I1PH00_9ACTN|nr:DinB family protein [Streptomyces aidingensis]SFD09109.1 Protein of unknown function [Streptomyces aidingensis]